MFSEIYIQVPIFGLIWHHKCRLIKKLGEALTEALEIYQSDVKTMNVP